MRYALRAPLLATLGTVSLAAGVVGIFVPLLPTTPFVLLASACYARSSHRLHAWLRAHPALGACVRAFEENRGVPRRAKALALGALWPSMAFAIPVVPFFGGQVALFSIAALVSAWLLAVPSPCGAAAAGQP